MLFMIRKPRYTCNHAEASSLDSLDCTFNSDQIVFFTFIKLELIVKQVEKRVCLNMANLGLNVV